MPFADLIAAQNKLARPNNKVWTKPHALVRVLQDARYNDPAHKAQYAKAGDVIAVAGGRYADDLLASGMVELYVEELPVSDDGDNAGEDRATDDADDSQDDDISDLVDTELAPGVNLAKLKVADLRTLAALSGIENTDDMKKAELIAALQAL